MNYHDYDQNNEQSAKKQELIELIRGAESNDKEVLSQVRTILENSPAEWRLANTKKKDGTSILMIAARQGLSRLVQYLLEQDARVSSVNRDHCDALMFACISGKRDIIEPILLKKANVDFRSKAGISAVMVAADRGHDKILKLLIDEYHAGFDHKMKNGANALTFAISAKHLDCVEFLLSAKADPNEALKDGTTPIMIAAERNHPAMIQLLIKNGANVNSTRGKTQETPLHMACGVQGGAKAAVQRLLEAKADVHACDVDGRTPLMYSVISPDVAQGLLAASADVNAPDDGGNTALMYACAQNTPPVSVLNLISARANVEVKNERGETALSIAAALNKPDMVNMLTYRIKQKKK